MHSIQMISVMFAYFFVGNTVTCKSQNINHYIKYFVCTCCLLSRCNPRLFKQAQRLNERRRKKRETCNNGKSAIQLEQGKSKLKQSSVIKSFRKNMQVWNKLYVSFDISNAFG